MRLKKDLNRWFYLSVVSSVMFVMLVVGSILLEGCMRKKSSSTEAKTLNEQEKNQVPHKTQDGDEIRCFGFDQYPAYKGGSAALKEFIVKTISYPKEAVEKGIQGRVVVEFTVTKDGKIEKLKVVRKVDPILDQEAIRGLKMMPDWIPGKREGKVIDMQYALPITFKLEEDASINE